VSTDTKGTMQQIREHLIEGKSSQEVIALGYAPGTVYKIQRRLKKRAVPAEDSPPLQGHQKESSSAPSTLLQGPLTVLLDTEEGVMFAVWHPEPPMPCPGCGIPVNHWDICLHCSRAVTDDCSCPPDSTACAEGFTFRELVRGVVDMR
jgi:hypothetical protein